MDSSERFFVFFFCALMLAGHRGTVRFVLSQFYGLLPVYTLTDMKVLIVCAVIILVMTATGLGFPSLFTTCGMLIFWNLVQIVRMNFRTGQERQTTGIMKRYDSRLLKLHYYGSHGSSHTEEYTFFAPVMRYEADGSEKESVSPVWTQECGLEKEAEYLICYSAVNPELFWFPEQKDRLALPYRTGLCVSAVFLAGLTAFYFSV